MDKKKLLTEYLINNKDKFYRFALMYVHHSADAYDIVSEATLKALTKIYLLKKTEGLNAWFYRILVRTIYDYTRRSRLFKTSTSEQVEMIEDENNQLSNQTIDLINFIQKLPPKYKTVIILKFYEDLTYEEISTVTHLPVSTVKSQVKKALEILRKEVMINE